MIAPVASMVDTAGGVVPGAVLAVVTTTVALRLLGSPQGLGEGGAGRRPRLGRRRRRGRRSHRRRLDR